MASLSPAEQARFKRDGYLHLPGFYPAAMIDHILTITERVKAARPPDVVVDEVATGARAVLALLAPEQLAEPGWKLYDLHVNTPEIRYLGLNEMVEPTLATLLGHVPVLCHSHYQDQATLQPPLPSALTLPPRTPSHLVSVLTAMEEAGGLELVPGSHTLKMLPLNGPDELDDWRTDMYEAARTAGHKKIRLSLAKGDVLILHAQLLHGSAAAPDMAATRKTYMFHYFTEPDLRATTTRLIPQAGGFWYKPQPRPLPLDVLDVLPFVEQAYLIRHPDVAQAVKDGHFATGQAHYEAFGKQEGRMPF